MRRIGSKTAADRAIAGALLAALAAAVLVGTLVWPPARGVAAWAPGWTALLAVGQKSPLDDVEEEPPADGPAPVDLDEGEEEPPADGPPPVDLDEGEEAEEAPPMDGPPPVDLDEGEEEEQAPPMDGPPPVDLDVGEEEPPLDGPGMGEEEPPLDGPGMGEEEPPLDGPGMGEEEPPLDAPEEEPLDAPEEGGPQDDLEPGVGEKDEEDVEPLCDVILWKREPQFETLRFEAALLEQYLGNKIPSSERRKKFRVRAYTQKGELYREIHGWQIEEIHYYEERMGAKAADMLFTTYAQLSESESAVNLNNPRLDDKAIEDAEKILRRAIAEHDSAVQRRVRRGRIWDDKVRRPLVQAWVNVRLSRIDELVKRGNLFEAEMECGRLRDELEPGTPQYGQVFARSEGIFGALAGKAMEAGSYAEVRDLIDQLAESYPGASSEKAAGYRRQMIDKAQARIDEAERLRESNPQAAAQLLDEAAKIWPASGQLMDLRRQMDLDYPVLDCAYTELPQSYSPLTARTAVERHAVALMFEGLVRWVDDPKSGAHYAAELAEGWPTPLERGREFHLPRCSWSDATDGDLQLCTVDDVRRTLDVLQDAKCPGYSPAMAAMLDDVRNPEGNPFRIRIVLSRDHWQPLSLMDFKVLPKHRMSAGGKSLSEQIAALARNPVCTGPYRLAEDNADPEAVRFTANPNYRTPGLPKIREIVFHRMDPVESERQFAADRIQLIYGVTAEVGRRLGQENSQIIALPTPTVSFLAPNYREDKMQNESLRLAIANAIDREKILDQYFRRDPSLPEHSALTGPYPKKCRTEKGTEEVWAYNARVPPFSPSTAKALAATACRELGRDKIPVRLSYPDDNPSVETACREIEKQVEAAAPSIDLELEPHDPATFYAMVTQAHDFELAYWNHTYKDSTYWIEPLLDGSPAARQPGGLNFMGYVPDTDMADFFGDLKRHKRFREIQDVTHRIHTHVNRKAVVIPLWQLDAYVAVSRRVTKKTLDPFVLYGDIENWELSPSGR